MSFEFKHVPREQSYPKDSATIIIELVVGTGLAVAAAQVDLTQIPDTAQQLLEIVLEASSVLPIVTPVNRETK